MILERPLLLLDHKQTGGVNRVPITKYQFLKPKDGKDYTWRRVRRGEWTRVSTLPPDEFFPEDTVKVKPVRQFGSTRVAHISEALDRKQDEE